MAMAKVRFIRAIKNKEFAIGGLRRRWSYGQIEEVPDALLPKYLEHRTLWELASPGATIGAGLESIAPAAAAEVKEALPPAHEPDSAASKPRDLSAMSTLELMEMASNRSLRVDKRMRGDKLREHLLVALKD